MARLGRGQPFKPKIGQPIVAAAGGTTSATISAVEAEDTAAITGLACSGVVAAPETSDTATVAATSAIASIAATETSDTAAVTGDANPGVTSATLAVIETEDTTAVTVAATVGAAITDTEAGDTAAITGIGNTSPPATQLGGGGTASGGGKRNLPKLEELEVFKKLEARKPGVSIEEALRVIDAPVVEEVARKAEEVIGVARAERPLPAPEIVVKLWDDASKLREELTAIQARAVVPPKVAPLVEDDEDAELLSILLLVL